MDPYTLNRSFHKQEMIDNFHSIIWTERYYGDSTVELVVPATHDMINKLRTGTFLSIEKSDEIMIIETVNIEEGKLKIVGISLLPWLDNRFVRASSKHDARWWKPVAMKPGQALWNIVQKMCVAGSPYLNGTINTGITNPSQFVIPGLGLHSYDTSGKNVKIAVPYGPVYKALREIAVTYKIGMQIILEEVTDTSFSLGFRSYKGLDRTSAQTTNSPVRFSPLMDSLTDIKELQSIAAFKTAVWAFAPGIIPKTLQTTPGVSRLTGTQYTGFDLRALMIFAEDIDTDVDDDLTQAELRDILKSRALDALRANGLIEAVDGEIVSTSQFRYGADYNLGDLIEVQGNSEIVSTCRVTEYIRTHDENGEREYPTVENIVNEEAVTS